MIQMNIVTIFSIKCSGCSHQNSKSHRAACAVCGLSVGIMWPGTFSKASAAIPKGGTAMFALLALGGDLGCSGGPTVVGAVSSVMGENLKMGILAAVVFPVLLLTGILVCGRMKKE